MEGSSIDSSGAEGVSRWVKGREQNNLQGKVAKGILIGKDRLYA